VSRLEDLRSSIGRLRREREVMLAELNRICESYRTLAAQS
jgi:hypothetical protein